MQALQRILGAVGLVLVGLFAWVFLGPQVTRCLGPLGRTLVDSIRDGCIDPSVGAGVPILVMSLVAAVHLLFPVRRPSLRFGAFGATLGGVVAMTTYLVARQTSLTGATLTGEVITIAMPIDWTMVLTAVMGGAGIGFLIAGRLLRRATTLPG